MQGEVISLALRAPCELDFAIQEVNEARPEERRLCFPDLHPAEPQPAEGYGVLLGRPAWADQVPVACIDARGLGDRLFAKPVSSRLTRESILLHVGMSAGSGVDVHVGHAWAPLRRGEMATLAHGTLITLAPARVLFRPGPSLQVMLLGTQGWQEEPAVPAGPTEKHVYILTDGLPITFSVATPRTGSFKAAVAQALQYDLERTSAQSSLPPITDFLSNGQACKGAVAFTEKICQIPGPPGLLRPPQYVVFLDLRAIFLGFEWALASNGLLAVDPLLARFSDRAPPFFKAVILGGTPRSEHGQTFHQVWSGQVLQVQFVGTSHVMILWIRRTCGALIRAPATPVILMAAMVIPLPVVHPQCTPIGGRGTMEALTDKVRVGAGLLDHLLPGAAQPRPSALCLPGAASCF
eukprot:s8422_g2.t1